MRSSLILYEVDDGDADGLAVLIAIALAYTGSNGGV